MSVDSYLSLSNQTRQSSYTFLDESVSLLNRQESSLFIGRLQSPAAPDFPQLRRPACALPHAAPAIGQPAAPSSPRRGRRRRLGVRRRRSGRGSGHGHACGSPRGWRSCKSRGCRRTRPGVVRVGDAGDVLGGEVAVGAVDQVAQLADIDKEGLALPVAVFAVAVILPRRF